MPSDLPLIIQQLDSERKFLERTIKSCVREGDYEFAHLYQAGLIQVNQQLRVCRRLYDPSGVELARLQRKMQRLQTARTRPILKNIPDYQEYLDDQQAELSTRIAHLEGSPAAFHVDGEDVLYALEDVLERNITEFRLRIPGHALIEVIRVANELHISIENLSEWTYYLLDDPGSAARLRRLGFDVSRGEARRSMADFTSATPWKLLTLLSAVVYEGLGLEEIPEATLEY